MKKKLIEVALPLEAINREAALRKRKAPAGYPTTIHKWWAQRPLAACRAVLFASLIDDPDQEGVPLELLDQIDNLPLTSHHGQQWSALSAGEQRRAKLFAFIEQLVKWENSNNQEILGTARELIHAATNDDPPPVIDPFCGGGSIPLEGQRLGLKVYASDLNPLAVLITKALIEIAPRFAGRPPINPESRQRELRVGWGGTAGLAADLRYYGERMRQKAEHRIGHLFPNVQLPKEQGGGEASVVAWLWARTVTCPNPACRAPLPLVRSFWLSIKTGRKAWIEPVINYDTKHIRFEVRTGDPDQQVSQRIEAGTAMPGQRNKKAKAAFQCLVCKVGVAKGEYIDAQASAGHVQFTPLAIVAEGIRSRVYLRFDEMQADAAKLADHLLQTKNFVGDIPDEMTRGTFASNAQGRAYGFATFGDYYTSRQLVALATLSSLLDEVRHEARLDAEDSGIQADQTPLSLHGRGPAAYADAIATYLAFALSRVSDYGNTLASWRPKDNAMRSAFSKQAVQMVWDFAEGSPFGSSSAGFRECVHVIAQCLTHLPLHIGSSAEQQDAMELPLARHALIATDPPYYANVSYADLSDFFYVWLRRSLGKVHPGLFTTLLTPKGSELVATPYRFDGDKDKARSFFQEGLGKAFHRMREIQLADYPLTIFYAVKESEEEGGTRTTAVASTGWETMLTGLLDAGFAITGTWPLRTEGDNRQVGNQANALASSILLVCRPRSSAAPVATRREFLTALKLELPTALRKLQHGNIAPVDLAQAAIGPSMAIYSRYSRVLESDGKTMRVKVALQIINQTLDEVLAEQEGEYDADTRWAIAWFEQYAHDDGLFGQADVLARAKDTSVSGLAQAGVVAARSGKVRLLRRDELAADWDPATDMRLTVWEATQHLIRALEGGGEGVAAALLRRVGARGEAARDLAYRLYTTCERKGWAQEALAYNSLVVAWPQLTQRADEPAEGEQLSYMRDL